MPGQKFSETKCQPGEEGDCLRCLCLFFRIPSLVLLGHSGPCQGTQNQGFCLDTTSKVPVSRTKLARAAPPQWSLYSLLCCWSSGTEKPGFFSLDMILKTSVYHGVSISVRHKLRANSSHWAQLSQPCLQ